MAAIALVVAVLALAVALVARGTARGLAERVERAEREARRAAANAAEDLRAEIERTRRLLAEVAAGRAPSEEMILEGRLWREVGHEEGRRLLEEGGAHVLDVRTPQETAGGVLPGARLVPIDELEGRLDELPNDGRPTLVYCAGGARSAAACELLSSRGWRNLHNLEAGFLGWPGAVERPVDRAVERPVERP